MNITKLIALLITLLTVSVSSEIYAQILDVYQSKLYNNDCQFNERFIKDNKVKIITGKISVKKDMQTISSKGLIIRYSFDREGKLTEQIKTMSLRGGRIDTTQSSFSYSQNNQLIQKAQFYVKAYDAVRYSYNNENKISAETVVRGANNNQYKYGFDKGTETIVKQERYEWMVTLSMVTTSRFVGLNWFHGVHSCRSWIFLSSSFYFPPPDFPTSQHGAFCLSSSFDLFFLIFPPPKRVLSARLSTSTEIKT